MGAVDDYLYVLEDAGIDTLVYDAEYYEDMAATLRHARLGCGICSRMGESKIGRPMARELAGIAPRPLVAPSCDPEALFRIAYSGGTTGKPKGIMTTHRTAMTSALIQLVSWEWPDEVRHLICAPLSHSGAAVLSAVLVKGGSMVVLPGFDPVKVMQAIEAAKNHLGADGADHGAGVDRPSAFW